METVENLTTEVLNDLLKINNDRIEGYEKATEEARDLDLKALFVSMADESRKNANQLSQIIYENGGDPAIKSTTTAGKIYRVWMDLKATFTGKDRKGILSSCEYGEDAAQAAYKDALANYDLPLDIREIILKQQAILKESHNVIKRYREMQTEYDKTI
jgi:uncharacterized protein (TIGR02284 family)